MRLVKSLNKGMSNETDIDDDHIHGWWEFYDDFACGDEQETPEQATKRIQREREEAYDRAMDII